MSIEIIGSFDKNTVFCAGSFSKLLTTYVCLSLLAEKYYLPDILDNDYFLGELCHQQKAKTFLSLFQKTIGTPFSIRDLCTFYAGLPYTFDVSEEELTEVELENGFKHHSIIDESLFLSRCQHQITLVYTSKCKFHYSELSILFLGYVIEQIYNIKIENLYHNYVISKFHLKNSIFSRTMPDNVYCQDLSNRYDYPSIAKLNLGFFCYSNGFFTTLNDMKILLENLINDPVFLQMTDINHARAASNTILNGLTVEIRQVNDDIIYGYEGLSYSGCNIWAYSNKHKKGYLTFTDDEEAAYPIIYNQWNYTQFDSVPSHTQEIYQNFIKKYSYDYEQKPIPKEYQGQYRRVKINEFNLTETFLVGENFIVIRNPDEIKYDIVFAKNAYRIKGKDNIPGAKIGLMQSKTGHYYMYLDGTLYQKIL